tara:strand:+ start:151 stop:303 length:153 start_codon:yes stop_codon:yes gene_type:complete
MAIVNLNTARRKCIHCKGDAHVYDKKRWFCGLNYYNAHGFCKVKRIQGVA